MYENMTAAELREVVTHLPDGLQRECYYGMGYWYRTDGQSISVPQAAEMLERACINFLTDNGYKSACAHYIEQNKVVSAWIKETHNSVGQQNVQGTGPTPLHAIVRAIEQMHKDGKANSDAPQVATGRTAMMVSHGVDEWAISLRRCGKRLYIALGTADQEAKVHFIDAGCDSGPFINLNRAGLLELRKAIDAAIERIGGEA